MRSIIMILLVVAALVSSLNAQDAESEENPLIQSNNKFAFDLYHTVSANNENMVFSPYSILQALGMLHALTLPEGEIDNYFADLYEVLTAPPEYEDILFQLNIANALWAQYYLNEKPVTYNVSPLEKGDYIIIDSPIDRHGFIVACWGDVITCTQAVQASSANPTSNFHDTWQTNTVPYVVDFSHGGQSQVQSEIPRPFYCSAYYEQFFDPAQNQFNGFFATHAWWFYTISDVVSINANQIYVNPEWLWPSP